MTDRRCLQQLARIYYGILLDVVEPEVPRRILQHQVRLVEVLVQRGEADGRGGSISTELELMRNALVEYYRSRLAV